MRGPNGCNMRCCLLVCLRGCRYVEISFKQPAKALRPIQKSANFYIPPKSQLVGDDEPISTTLRPCGPPPLS